MPRTHKAPTVEEIIHKAIAAQRVASDRQAKDTFKTTEKRLYAYEMIKAKIISDRWEIEDIKQFGAPGKSKSIVKYQRGGMRLSPEELSEALINDLLAEIAKSEHEIEKIDHACRLIANDPYADIIKHKYFEGKTDEAIGAIMNCDPSTVRRHKSRLVARISVYFYGVDAVI